MKILNRQQGQTLIETALVLFLLLLILLGIAEFSRAWFIKNSLKNAARQGARVAVVTSSAPIVQCPSDPIICDQTRSFTPCPGSNDIINSICNSPGISSANTWVSICYLNQPIFPATLEAGDTVNVCVQRRNFATVVPRMLGSFIPSIFYAEASMRYE